MKFTKGISGTIADGSTVSAIKIKSGDMPLEGHLLFFRQWGQISRVSKTMDENSFKVHPELTRIPSENDTYEGGVQWSAK
jgi:hypothetical protein